MQTTCPAPRLPLAIGLALAVAVALAGCGKPAAPPQAAVQAPPDPLAVQVKPEMASRFKTAKLVATPIASVQEITGRIEADGRRVSRIGAAVTGRVTDVMVELGDVVKAGQPLARLSSPELTQAQLAAMRAHAQSELAERATERARQLFAADVIGSAELQRRESEQTIARAELRAASAQLQLLGLSPSAIASLRTSGNLSSAVVASSPRAGVVIERSVSQGQVAQPGDALFTVADLGQVWVVGALPEQSATTVEVGQAITIAVPALGNTVLEGKVVAVGATVQPETRTVAIRTEVDNAHRLLKPQMLATMRISGAAKSTLAVPSAAVVRENDRDNVFVRTGTDRYRLTQVDLGPATDGPRPLRQGPAAGTEIVVDGAFHLNNERKRAEME